MVASTNVKLGVSFLMILVGSFFTQQSLAFVIPKHQGTSTSTFFSTRSKSSARYISRLPMAMDANNSEHHNESPKDRRDGNPVRAHEKDWETLQIHIVRMRLEEGNKRRFLKSRPAKFSYEQSKRWVQDQNMWHSKEDWYEWVELGENLSPYIPSDPEVYYKVSGSWIDWDDYLGL